MMQVRLGGAMPQDALEIVDISLRGIGVKISLPLAAGQEVMVVVVHPILEKPVNLRTQVAWCRMKPNNPHPFAGLEIVGSSERDRMQLRRIQASEVSCRVLDGERTAGFVMTQGEGRWALYDDATVKVAFLAQRGPQFQVSFIGTSPSESVHQLDAGSLPDALALAFELGTPPFVVPPEGGRWFAIKDAAQAPASPAAPAARPSVPKAPRAPQRREPVAPVEPPKETPSREQASLAAVRAASPTAFHSVTAGGYHVGYIAVTSIDDVWSLYDEAWNEVAIMSPDQAGFKLVFTGDDPNESLEYLMAKTFLGGVKLAFDLKVAPEIKPPLLAALDPGDSALDAAPSATPAAPRAINESDEEAPLPVDRPHHCIIDSGLGLTGYIARATGLLDFWSVYNASREKVATVGQDGARWKILFVGGNPEDSLEYMVARSFKGALALTFDLESLPSLDPPLE